MPATSSTQVAIIGAGPAGLALGRLLKGRGIESTILESRARGYVEQRVRAGVLEPGTVELLAGCGLDARLRREGMLQRGIDLRFNRASHHVPVAELTGRPMTVYGQSEIVKDLIRARVEDGDPLHFEVEHVQLHDIASSRPWVTYRHGGSRHRLDCELIAGCDGFHGVTRQHIPADIRRMYEHRYPFSWVGILADVPSSSDELVYTRHERGFALLTLRTPEISRLYVQCQPEDDLADWPDERVWEELHVRLETDSGFELREGPVLEKGITQLRSYVIEPMQFGRLFIAGDAAHIVPPTGAKGLNMALADVRELDEAIGAFLLDGEASKLEQYSARCLRRIWRTQQFSWLMTSLLHRFPDADAFQHQLQTAELEHIVASRGAARSFAERYIGAEPSWNDV